MKLKCLNVIADFKDVFPKGELFDATEMRNDFCDVTGNRPKKNGTPWTGVQSLGHVVVLGVAKFEIVGALDKESSDGV